MNRVAHAITEVQLRIAALEHREYSKLDAAMAIDFGEHFAYQQAQSEAFASGLLTLDESQVIYRALGPVVSQDTNGGWSADTDLATKVIVVKLVGELLERRRSA